MSERMVASRSESRRVEGWAASFTTTGRTDSSQDASAGSEDIRGPDKGSALLRRVSSKVDFIILKMSLGHCLVKLGGLTVVVQLQPCPWARTPCQ